ncbi:hypothetical protein AYI69_g291 [Smittium culicis]|uniref:Uncharacterized protein n=1 Tax=Smittium culicis TaxID=133412 RepID=A0A1R1YTF3_9FUNG|nr:hypothetical protein AYI69_g291 [Smittium culicis]
MNLVSFGRNRLSFGDFLFKHIDFFYDECGLLILFVLTGGLIPTLLFYMFYQSVLISNGYTCNESYKRKILFDAENLKLLYINKNLAEKKELIFDDNEIPLYVILKPDQDITDENIVDIDGNRVDLSLYRIAQSEEIRIPYSKGLLGNLKMFLLNFFFNKE